VEGWFEAAIVVTRVGFLDCSKADVGAKSVFEISTRFLVISITECARTKVL
jgi:hypothetical protein